MDIKISKLKKKENDLNILLNKKEKKTQSTCEVVKQRNLMGKVIVQRGKKRNRKVCIRDSTTT